MDMEHTSPTGTTVTVRLKQSVAQVTVGSHLDPDSEKHHQDERPLIPLRNRNYVLDHSVEMVKTPEAKGNRDTVEKADLSQSHMIMLNIIQTFFKPNRGADVTCKSPAKLHFTPGCK